MADQLNIAEKKVLVEVVKLAQKRGMSGAKGVWKDFLNSYDKQLGASLSDPSRRSKEVLVAFLKTFTDESDLKLFAKVIQCHSNHALTELFKEESPQHESPEQRLVHLTLEHPQYPSEYSFPSYEEEWVVTKLKKKSKVMRSTDVVAVDCEMVLCEDGTEACVRVCVVDRSLKVKLNEFVNPGKAIADYRTEITGIVAADLDGIKCSLSDVQKSMKKLLSHGTIIVGHSLNGDLRALKLDHARVIDTSYIFQYPDASFQRKPSLNNLCKSVLGYEVRAKGAPHNCLDDASAVMKLVLAVIERGCDTNILCLHDDVPDSEVAKLLLHRIPKIVPVGELYRAIPGEFTVEPKPSKNARGDTYSALAVFSSMEEAHRVYESLEGTSEKDSYERSQKVITLHLSTVLRLIYFLKKRAAEMLDSGDLKKQKASKIGEIETAGVNQCDDHLKEIERLKEELRQKDLQIVSRCGDHLQEIERLKHELSQKKLKISILHKIVQQQK
ncbi:small RNA degrading nuclease 3-like [Rhodamnia argentea]|uniref:Small RNA degrading nuclease 3-like n=1 Tax=Rhodamnia argentea TaxID=178133 RepID=A0ABM3H6I2_9MYRT|nr:small RNA degrading nuclease 3-like [Rhodamnia argentea]